MPPQDISEKADTGLGNGTPVHVDHAEGKELPPEVITPDEGAVNVLLILACVAFGSASFLFGYDDKVISPVAALTAFVRTIQINPKI